MMAGNGPDIILFDHVSSRYLDIYKTQDAGTLADLTELMEGDEEFERSLYFERVLDAAKRNGKQYVIPLQFTTPGSSLLKEDTRIAVNLDPEMTYSEVMEEIYRYWQENSENPDAGTALPSWSVRPGQFQVSVEPFLITRPPIVDYATMTHNLDDPAVQRFFEIWEHCYPYENPLAWGGERLSRKRHPGSI